MQNVIFDKKFTGPIFRLCSHFVHKIHFIPLVEDCYDAFLRLFKLCVATDSAYELQCL